MSDRTLARYNMTSRYMNNQTEDEWDTLTRSVMEEARRADNIQEPIERAAWDIMRASYWSAVRGVVADCASETFEDEDARRTYVEESVDGSQWVIYTWRAGLVLALSDNDDAYADQIGGAPENANVGAYYAMLQDVMNTLPAWEDAEEEEEEG